MKLEITEVDCLRANDARAERRRYRAKSEGVYEDCAITLTCPVAQALQRVYPLATIEAFRVTAQVGVQCFRYSPKLAYAVALFDSGNAFPAGEYELNSP